MKTFKRAISSILAFVMVFSMITILNVSNAFAADVEYAPTSSSTVDADTQITDNDYFTLYAGTYKLALSKDSIKASGSSINSSNIPVTLTNGVSSSYTARLILKFVPKENGQIEFTTTSIATGKNVKILEVLEGSPTSGTATDESSTGFKCKSVFDWDQSSAETSWKATVEANKTYYFAPQGTDTTVKKVAFTKASTDPSINLKGVTDNKLSVATGNSAEFSYTLDNDEGSTVTVASSDENVVKVSDNSGTVTVSAAEGASVGDTATITLTSSGSAPAVTINVTIIKPITDVTVTKVAGVSSVTLTNTEDSAKVYTVSTTGKVQDEADTLTISDVEYGTYNVSYVNSAPTTWSITSAPETYTVDANNNTVIIEGEYITGTVDELKAIDYQKYVIGETLVWNMSADSLQYVGIAQNKGIIKVAPTGESGAYALVNTVNTSSDSNKKIDTRRDSSFQFNSGTIFTVPVAKDSVITVVMSDSKVGALTINGETLTPSSSNSYTVSYTYTGTDNSTVDIVSGGSYGISITVDTPAPDEGKVEVAPKENGDTITYDFTTHKNATLVTSSETGAYGTASNSDDSTSTDGCYVSLSSTGAKLVDSGNDVMTTLNMPITNGGKGVKKVVVEGEFTVVDAYGSSWTMFELYDSDGNVIASLVTGKDNSKNYLGIKSGSTLTSDTVVKIDVDTKCSFTFTVDYSEKKAYLSLNNTSSSNNIEAALDYSSCNISDVAMLKAKTTYTANRSMVIPKISIGVEKYIVQTTSKAGNGTPVGIYADGNNNYYLVCVVSKDDTGKAADKVVPARNDNYIEGTESDTVYAGVEIGNVDYTAEDFGTSANDYVYAIKITGGESNAETILKAVKEFKTKYITTATE